MVFLRVKSRGRGELLRVSSLKASSSKVSSLRNCLLCSVGFIATFWVCCVSAQVSMTTTVHKLQAVATLAKTQPASGRDAQGVDLALTNVDPEPGYEWVEAEFSVPGDTLLYSLKVQNNGQYTVPKGHLRIEDKVPQGSILAPQTLLQEDVLTAFSVSADGQYFVAGASALGSADGWRWLRWEYLKPLAPGQSFNLSFQTKLLGETDEQEGSQGDSALTEF